MDVDKESARAGERGFARIVLYISLPLIIVAFLIVYFLT